MSSASLSGVCVQPASMPFSKILSGKKAFHAQPDYLEATQREFAASEPLPTHYTWETEQKTSCIARFLISAMSFPIGILHVLVGKFILLPASSPTLFGHPKGFTNTCRSMIPLGQEWKYKRITVEADGYKVDAMIVGKASTLNNRRWVLASNGNGEFYEVKLLREDFRQILNQVDGNGLVFNYPGVGASSGLPSRQAMAKAYRAMLTFLEDRKEGLGARAIIGYGHSIGAGVQGDALMTHELKEGIKYLFIKSRTFSALSAVASALTYRPLGFLIKLLGWNMDPAESSKNLQAPEIIIQSAKVEEHEELVDSSKIVHDWVIPPEASLAKALLEDPACSKGNKIFIGVQEKHNDSLDPSFLVNKIKTILNIF